jgi:23S rRNA (adenine2503-C2)-methyltransferase
MIEKKDIKDFTGEQLTAWLAEINVAPYRSGQILRWVYKRQADSFAEMTDLSQETRDRLAAHFTIDRLQKICVAQSQDGSKKYLFGLKDGNRIESVLIPEKGHFTLCISSQVGCAQGCRFCLTGRDGFGRNLSKGEIVGQIRDIQKDLQDPRLLTNVVLMGMGEPLANFKNVVNALQTMTDSGTGFGFAGRRITLSTAGLINRLC